MDKKTPNNKAALSFTEGKRQTKRSLAFAGTQLTLDQVSSKRDPEVFSNTTADKSLQDEIETLTAKSNGHQANTAENVDGLATDINDRDDGGLVVERESISEQHPDQQPTDSTERQASLPQMDLVMYVGNLACDVTGKLLDNTFGKYKSYTTSEIIRDPVKQEPRYGFAHFSDCTDYSRALRELNNTYVGSKPVFLKVARAGKDGTWKTRPNERTGLKQNALNSLK